MITNSVHFQQPSAKRQQWHEHTIVDLHPPSLSSQYSIRYFAGRFVQTKPCFQCNLYADSQHEFHPYQFSLAQGYPEQTNEKSRDLEKLTHPPSNNSQKQPKNQNRCLLKRHNPFALSTAPLLGNIQVLLQSLSKIVEILSFNFTSLLFKMRIITLYVYRRETPLNTLSKPKRKNGFVRYITTKLGAFL